MEEPGVHEGINERGTLESCQKSLFPFSGVCWRMNFALRNV
jgi:hypothetical protein